MVEIVNVIQWRAELAGFMIRLLRKREPRSIRMTLIGDLFNRLIVLSACIGTSLAQSVDIPDWQVAAGGKLAFDVASVKRTNTPKLPSFPLDNGNTKTSGGRFSASFGLGSYIGFAYKLSPRQAQALSAQLPKWANMERFEIDALAPGNPTKDQMRLMMQSLLADRFKLSVHSETRETPVLVLSLAEPGKTGPKLRPHAEGPPCPDSYTPLALTAPPKTGDAFPPECNTTPSRFKSDGTALVGSRNSSMQSLSEMVEAYGFLSGEIDRAVVDRTGLLGTFDYIIEWNGRLPGPPPSAGAEVPPTEPGGTTFLQALREQLGLKLVRSTAGVRTIVIDHVEGPSEN